jgi:hypothetical protein
VGTAVIFVANLGITGAIRVIRVGHVSKMTSIPTTSIRQSEATRVNEEIAHIAARREYTSEPGLNTTHLKDAWESFTAEAPACLKVSSLSKSCRLVDLLHISLINERL